MLYRDGFCTEIFDFTDNWYRMQSSSCLMFGRLHHGPRNLSVHSLRSWLWLILVEHSNAIRQTRADKIRTTPFPGHLTLFIQFPGWLAVCIPRVSISRVPRLHRRPGCIPVRISTSSCPRSDCACHRGAGHLTQIYYVLPWLVEWHVDKDSSMQRAS